MSSCRLIADKIWADLEQDVSRAFQNNHAAVLAWPYARRRYSELAQASGREVLQIRTLRSSEASDPRIACGRQAVCFFPQKYEE